MLEVYLKYKIFDSAAELRVLYKPELAELVSKETLSGPVSVQQTVDVLSHLLEILECDVFGFLGVDQSEVVILIKPIMPQPSMLQVPHTQLILTSLA